MTDTTARNREYQAGGLMALIGLGTILEARTYDIGSLTQMGPGFLPAVLGAVLVLCGIMIAIGGRHAANPLPVHGGEPAHSVVPPLDWRGGIAIAAGVATFIAVGEYAGLVPAIFACVFIAAIGDRTTTMRGAALLAAAVTVFGTGLFAYVLKVPFPLFRW